MFGRNCVDKSSKGVTLLECLITLTLLVILSAALLVSYRSFAANNQLIVSVNNLVNALQYARDSAITLHTHIIFCAKDHDACGTDWQNGQLIINGDDYTVLRVLPALPHDVQLSWRSSLGKSADLRWRPSGFTDGQQGSFFLYSSASAEAAKIVVLRTGRLRVVAI